ncbi:MAG: protein-L-isoaspartate O-methyltransferase [Pseudomonadota bacterium]
MNLEQARFNMIEQQIRTWDVLDSTVLDVMRDVPREEFVSARHRKLAFSDLRIPIGHDQFMMKPIEQGRMLQGMQLSGHERVLEIGTGSGYLTACLAQLTDSLTSIEFHADLARQAGQRLEEHSDAAIEMLQGDVLVAEFADDAFDVILVTASAATVPDVFSRWLSPGGRVLMVLGHAPAMEAVLLTRSSDRRWMQESLFDTDMPRLIGAEDAPVFEF